MCILSIIEENPKLAPIFNNCIGATDGSLISAIIPSYEQGPWRDRKGNITQNIHIVANFDLLYTYALCGWEGSAPDQRVLEDSYDKGLNIPNNKILLADAAFTLCPKGGSFALGGAERSFNIAKSCCWLVSFLTNIGF